MKKMILISREGGETRACLLASGQLVNIDAEGTSGSSIIGNIYKGKISDISRSLNAAFIDIGSPKEGFLSINDVHPAILEGFPKRPFMSEIFSRNQDVLVQVVRDPVGEKGAMLTTCISLPGRYVVLMPAVEKTGISKKLPEDERQRLREIIEEVEIPEGFGVIVRTAGQDRKKQELLADLDELIKVWKQIEAVYGESSSPALVLQEQSLAIRFLREYLTPDVNEIIVDDEALRKEVGAFLNVVMPKYKKMLKHYTDRLPLFVRYAVESQIEKMFLRDVPLPSGGRIVIDKTEALIAVDVNSARHKEKDIEETALRSNMEAAQEIAIQCKLRDLGGLIVIDFIDMYQQKNRNLVQQHIKECFKDDKAKVSFGKISQFGLLEMTRQKLRSGLVSRATESCSRCGGVGYVRTIPSMGLHVLRRIREMAVSGNADAITVNAPVEVANFMHNGLRGLLLDLERQHGVRVVIQGRVDLIEETIEATRSEVPARKEAETTRPAPAPFVAEAAPEEGPGAVPEAPGGDAPQAADSTASSGEAGPERAEGAGRDRRRRDRGRKKGDKAQPQVEASPQGKVLPADGAGKPSGGDAHAAQPGGESPEAGSKVEAEGESRDKPRARRDRRGRKKETTEERPVGAERGLQESDSAPMPQRVESAVGAAESGAVGVTAEEAGPVVPSPTAEEGLPSSESRSKRRRRRKRNRNDLPIQGELADGDSAQTTPAADGSAAADKAAYEPPPLPPAAFGPQGGRTVAGDISDDRLARDGLLDTILKRLLGLDR